MNGTKTQLRTVLSRWLQIRLGLGVGAALALAALDGLALGLVVPVVNLTSGQPVQYGADLIETLVGPLDERSTEVTLVVALVTLFLLKNVLSVLLNWWTTGLIFFGRAQTSARMMKLSLTRNFELSSQQGAAELVRNMTDLVGQVFNGSVNGAITSVNSALQLGVIVLALLIIAPVPSLVLFLYFGLLAVIYGLLIRRRATQLGSEMASASEEAWKWALAGNGGLREIHLRRADEFFVQRYLDSSMRGAKAQRAVSVLMSAPRSYLEVAFIVAVGILIVLSTSEGETVGLVALFVTAGFRSLPTMSGLLGARSSVRAASVALAIVADEIGSPLARESDDGEEVDHLALMTLDGVSYRYPGRSEDALKGVTVDIHPGSSVGIVGRSGGGKSTMIDVILGLRRPTGGAVRVGGVDIAKAMASWQAGIAYVPQEIFLLNGTIFENIAFENVDRLDRKRLKEAVTAAQLDEVIKDLPLGLATVVGERGASLSGGQRQRLGIARALYRAPKLLILDEATSALDNETERDFVATLESLPETITKVVVAHRLSTVKNCDVIHFMLGGRIVDSGTFNELEARNDTFASLVRGGEMR